MDHRPDGRSMDELRQDVREELVKNDLLETEDEGDDAQIPKDSTEEDETEELQRATQSLALVSGGGIADEQGLGWAGELVNKRLFFADLSEKHKETIACHAPAASAQS